MDVRDLLCGVYDGSILLPAAVNCPKCENTAVLYPVSGPYPWIYCSDCGAAGQLRRASVIIRPRVDYRAATYDDIPKIVLFIKRLCGITCNALEAQRLLPFFVGVVYNQCRHVALAFEDAPERCISTLSCVRRGSSTTLVFRSAWKHRRLAFDPGVALASRIFKQQRLCDTTLFLFPVDDALRLHAEHARTCDCVLPVISASAPTYFADMHRWCAAICSVLNIISVRRRIVCIKARSLQDVSPNLLRWAARLHARIFLYESLPIIHDVHELLRGVRRAAFRVPQCHIHFAGPDKRKLRALPLYGDYGVLKITSSARPLLRHGDMWYRVDSMDPILSCDVRLQEVIMPDGVYRYSICYEDRQVFVEVKPGDPLIPAILQAFDGQPYVPIIEANEREIKRIALVAGVPKVSWRN